MPREQADFAGFTAEKTRTAAAAPIERLSTNVDASAGESVHGIGNEWSRTHYGGDFNLYMPPDGGTALSLVRPVEERQYRRQGSLSPGRRPHR